MNSTQRLRCLVLLVGVLQLATHALGFEAQAPNEENTVIAFGSCADDENVESPVWNSIYHASPDAMIFMGDNVYLDLPSLTPDSTIDAFEPDYARLANTPSFKRLKAEVPVHATWDDNDYGMRDGGSNFPLKAISQSKFLDFWGVSEDSERAKTPGIYGSGWVQSGSRRVQIILTDTRYFRSQLVRESSSSCTVGDIVASEDPERTILGADQWAWLEQALAAEADMHVLVSGIQVLADEHCFERWGALPLERKRLFDLIANASAYTVIVSGDRHLGEISALPADDPDGVGYPLIDATSSPLSSRYGWGEGEVNRLRISNDNVRVPNFGILDVDWQNSRITVQLRNDLGEVEQQVSHEIPN